MRFHALLAWSAAGLGLTAAPGALMAEPTGPVEAIVAGKASVTVRARYEAVHQDGFAENADALTALLRLNYATGVWNGWSGFTELDQVFHVVNDFNSGAGTSPGKDQYPVVADPEGADLNQLYLDYRVNEAWLFRAGRQRILLDDQRFVGGVGWRQNEQTYDGITAKISVIPRSALQYDYVTRVRRIFGPTVPAGANDVETHLLNTKISLDGSWSLTPYYYYIDNHDVAGFSTSTVGARVAGELRMAEDAKLAITLEYAWQSDAANNPVEYRARYGYADAKFSFDNGLSLGIAYQSLGGDSTESGKMFRTPLATLHKFQGWADVFLTTPPQGINDLYGTITLDTAGWTFTGMYHNFSPEAGSGDYGSEVDVSASRKLGEHHALLIKGAFFDGNLPLYPDASKFWVMFTASY